MCIYCLVARSTNKWLKLSINLRIKNTVKGETGSVVTHCLTLQQILKGSCHEESHFLCIFIYKRSLYYKNTKSENITHLPKRAFIVTSMKKTKQNNNKKPWKWWVILNNFESLKTAIILVKTGAKCSHINAFRPSLNKQLRK